MADSANSIAGTVFLQPAYDSPIVPLVAMPYGVFRLSNLAARGAYTPGCVTSFTALSLNYQLNFLLVTICRFQFHLPP